MSSLIGILNTAMESAITGAFDGVDYNNAGDTMKAATKASQAVAAIKTAGAAVEQAEAAKAALEYADDLGALKGIGKLAQAAPGALGSQLLA